MIRLLRKKFILVNMLLVFVVLAIVFTAIVITAYRRNQSQVQMTLQLAFSRRGNEPPPQFGQLGEGRDPQGSMARSNAFLLEIGPDGQARLVYADNIELTDSQVAEIAALALESGQAEGLLRGYSLRYLVRNEAGTTRIAFADVYREEISFRNTILTTAASLLASLAAFFAVSLFLSRWALRPVERAWEQQRRFVADASHELKTPLTVILANVGILRANRISTIDSQIKWLENTEAEAGRMKQLVDDLLFLAKTDDALIARITVPLNYSDLVTSMALTFESLAFERGITLDTTNVRQGANVRGDEVQLKQMLSVLVDNAIKYSNPGGVVRLALHIRQSKAVLSVSNIGALLSADEQAHLFERFYRADQSRSREGYGLGLSIAKGIADGHGGKITVESSMANGTVFTVTLPAV